MNNAVLGLGSNVGDRMSNLKKAITAISRIPETKLVRASNIYETKPVGYLDQDDFLNLNIMIETNLSPSAVLGACFGIESCLGRVRNIKNGPRKIDIDLLIYESVRMETFELTLPHPRILERAFVLKPLLDLYPSGRAPGLFFSPKLKEISTEGVELYNEKISL
ncbi:MAG: 2-amino-4-hydroxy-6-hydroxymethyldihydropteridine diphosphokinase [Clostridia bacterium]|nr:2-amino-4-hydroxy-6-hydroxymethyldihydropteridine diphosphokinase [Clostridia bacterium]